MHLPDPNTDDRLIQWAKGAGDVLKVRIDLFKHVGTLSSGAVVVLAAFVREIPSGASVAALKWALGLLVATVFLSAAAAFFSLHLLLSINEFQSKINGIDKLIKATDGSAIGLFPIITFLGSMVALGIFIFSVL